MVMTRGQFTDLFLSNQLPLLEDIIANKYAEKPDMISMIFNVESSDKWGEQDTTIAGLGTAPSVAEGTDISYDDMIQGYDKTYTHTKYGVGIKITEETIEDDKFGLIRNRAAALGRSMFNTRQVEAASVFNNGFTAANAGPDGVELFSAVHPLVGGGTEQNELSTAADLTVDSLEQALIDLEDTTDERGIRINVRAKYLLVPSNLKFQARRLLDSALKPDTAENAINAFQDDGLEYMVWNYLTDSDAWFLVGEQGDHSLKWFDRRLPTVESDVDFDAGSVKTKITSRFSHGWSDWRGVYGSPGA